MADGMVIGFMPKLTHFIANFADWIEDILTHAHMNCVRGDEMLMFRLNVQLIWMHWLCISIKLRWLMRWQDA